MKKGHRTAEARGPVGTAHLDSEWQRKGASLSDKTARKEFGLTQEEILRAIKDRRASVPAELGLRESLPAAAPARGGSPGCEQARKGIRAAPASDGGGGPHQPGAEAAQDACQRPREAEVGASSRHRPRGRRPPRAPCAGAWASRAAGRPAQTAELNPWAGRPAEGRAGGERAPPAQQLPGVALRGGSPAVAGRTPVVGRWTHDDR